MKKAVKNAQQRVAIAIDVIARIDAGQLDVRSNKGYFYAPVLYESTRRVDLALKGKVCEVCAIGGLFVAAVIRHNGIVMSNAEFNHTNPDGGVTAGRWSLTQYLGRWFSDVQLDLMESAFEGYSDERSRGIYLNYPDDADRLRAIMANVIRNGGTFCPKTEPDWPRGTGRGSWEAFRHGSQAC